MEASSGDSESGHDFPVVNGADPPTTNGADSPTMNEGETPVMNGTGPIAENGANFPDNDEDQRHAVPPDLGIVDDDFEDAMEAAAGGGAENDPGLPSVGIPPDLDLSGDHERCTMFMPPLYTQRYSAVCRYLADTARFGAVARVLDMGCAEMQFLQILKNVPAVSDVILLDLLEETLRRNLERAAPGFRDRLERRTQPLCVRVLCGDVTQRDARLRGLDAVTGIEIIEHLEADVLAALPATLFGYMRPRLVVLTTPNQEFNQLFPDFSGMRHWDHKFEWTRAEFQSWCSGVVAQYPEYSVEFDGVGSPPAESQHLGHCSQLALFHRASDPADAAAADPAGGPTPHTLLQRSDFPYESRESRLFSEVIFWKRQLGFGRAADSEDRHGRHLISLNIIMAIGSVADAAGSLQELVTLLRQHGEPVVEHEGEPCVVYQLPDSSGDTSEEEEVAEAEDERAGGDLGPEPGVQAASEPGGADRAAGDATYHEDWDRETDWETEILQSSSRGSSAGSSWAGRHGPGPGWSDGPLLPRGITYPHPADFRRYLLSRLLSEILRVCFPESWLAPLLPVVPSIIAGYNFR